MEENSRMMHKLTDRLTIGGAPAGEDDLRRLGAAGYRSIVDLRSDGEPRPQGLAPWDEATLARRAGLAYRQIAVEPQLLGDALAHAVRRAVQASTPPVLLHCTTGRRAGTFGLVLLACEEDLTVEECLARGGAMGLDWSGMPRLTVFLRQFVERNGRHYHPEGDRAAGR
jgi:uncharacterized protein (TIGR01244 family)